MEVTERRPSGRSVGRLSSTRNGTILIAVVCAVVAGAILVVGLHQYRKSIESSSTPATVLVATRTIQQGTSGHEIAVGEYFKPSKILDKQVTTGAFADPAALHNEVAATNIYPGQQLAASDFVSTAALSTQLTAGERAVAVSVDDSRGLIPDLKAGEHVDVYASFSGGNSGGRPFVRLLAADVTVLKPSESSNGGALGSKELTVVLAVNVHQSAELAYAVDNGKVWLALRPGVASPTGGEIVNEETILLGHTKLSTLLEKLGIPRSGKRAEAALSVLSEAAAESAKEKP
jgi:Flp pilus assembly protein CpaB